MPDSELCSGPCPQRAYRPDLMKVKVLQESFTHLFLYLSLAFLSSALYLRRSELSGCISQAKLEYGWVWPKRGTEERMEGGRIGEAKVLVQPSF